MARYIARNNGLYPTNPLEAYQCDMLMDAWGSVLLAMNGWNFEPSTAAAKSKEKALNEILPKFFDKLKPYTSKDEWLIGDGK